MTKIIYWDNLNPYCDDDILVMTSMGYELLCEGISKGELKYPKKCFVLAPNAEERDIPLLMHYIKHCLIGLDVPIESSKYDLEHREFLNRWHSLIESLNNIDHLASLAKLSDIHLLTKGHLLTNFDKLHDELRQYLDTIMWPLVEDTPFLRTPTHIKLNCWHQAVVNQKNLLKEYLAKMDAHSYKDIQIVKNLKVAAERIYRIWSRYEQMNAYDKLFHVSAYLFFLAKISMKRRQNIMSLVFVHRAMDIYFQNIAMENSLIIEHPKGLVYKPFLGVKDRISLMTTEYVLVQRGIIASDLSRKNYLEWLNTTRNLSILAHGVYGVTSLETENALDKCSAIIKKIEGDLRWQQVSENYSLSNLFNYSNLYDFEREIDSYCALK